MIEGERGRGLIEPHRLELLSRRLSPDTFAALLEGENVDQTICYDCMDGEVSPGQSPESRSAITPSEETFDTLY